MSDVRRAFAARLEEEGLRDFRLKELTRSIGRLSDERAAEMIELIFVGLDAARNARSEVLWLVDNEFRRSERHLPHHARLAFLRWVVKRRVAHPKAVAALAELRAASTEGERDRILDGLSGDAASGPSLADAHPVFAHAWRAAPPQARPVGPIHRGEPAPVIGPRGTAQLAEFIAQRIAPLVPSAEGEAWGEIRALAERAATPGKPPSRSASAKVVALLLEAGGIDAIGRFLADLDAELRRLDVVHALGRRAIEPSRPIAQAILRAGDGTGKVVLWLALLREPEGGGARGNLGLLAKEGRFWRWTEGARDEVLATVSDEHFERAVMAASSAMFTEREPARAPRVTRARRPPPPPG